MKKTNCYLEFFFKNRLRKKPIPFNFDFLYTSRVWCKCRSSPNNDWLMEIRLDKEGHICYPGVAYKRKFYFLCPKKLMSLSDIDTINVFLKNKKNQYEASEKAIIKKINSIFRNVLKNYPNLKGTIFVKIFTSGKNWAICSPNAGNNENQNLFEFIKDKWNIDLVLGFSNDLVNFSETSITYYNGEYSTHNPNLEKRINNSKLVPLNISPDKSKEIFRMISKEENEAFELFLVG